MFAPGKIINASQKFINKMYKKVSGTSVTLNNAARSKLHGLTIYGKTVQNGIPTPGNPVPIQVVGLNDDNKFGIQINEMFYSIDLKGNVLASLPDGTKDVLTVDNTGAVTLEKRVGVTTLTLSGAWGQASEFNNPNGFSIWGYSNNTSISDIATYTGTDSRSLIMCDSLTVATDNDPMLTNVFFWSRAAYTPPGSPTNELFIFNAAGATTANEAKDAINAMNARVVYPLATAQTIDLGYIDMPIVSNKSQVSIISKIVSNIDVEYKKDLIYISAYSG